MTESCSREFPEQRSESRQSLCGKIVDEEPSFKTFQRILFPVVYIISNLIGPLMLLV